MRTSLAAVSLLASLAGCAGQPAPTKPTGGTTPEEIGPVPPVDYKSLDMKAAVEEALQYGSLVTMAAAWRGHVGALDQGEAQCPTIWAGFPPEDFVDIEVDDEDAQGLSWTGGCATYPEGVTFDGWSWWETATDGVVGTRSLIMDAVITDAAGEVLLDFDGEASDSLDLSNGSLYTSEFNGIITGPLAGIGSGLRANNNSGDDDGGGGFLASWSGDGTIDFMGAVEAFDGFGPPDERDPNLAPELQDLVGWEPGGPRFTSIRFQLEFRGDCPQEPYGYVGIRGNEGFWFDVYFLPLYDPGLDSDGDGQPDGESAESNAYPYEQIDNITCDGVGTVFARNVDLKSADELDDAWSREVAPDFAAVVAALPTPSMQDYVYTLRNLPE